MTDPQWLVDAFGALIRDHTGVHADPRFANAARRSYLEEEWAALVDPSKARATPDLLQKVVWAEERFAPFWQQLTELIVSAGLTVPLRGSDDLIVPALLRGTDVFDAPDDAPRCRLHFSLTAHGARGFELLGEAQLRKEGFLPLGAYDHLCATLMVWAQRTIKGRHEPKLKRQSIEIRLSKHTLVRAARPMRTQSCRHNACRPSAVRRRLLPHPSPPLAALQMHAAPRPLRASTS